MAILQHHRCRAKADTWTIIYSIGIIHYTSFLRTNHFVSVLSYTQNINSTCHLIPLRFSCPLAIIMAGDIKDAPMAVIHVIRINYSRTSSRDNTTEEAQAACHHSIGACVWGVLVSVNLIEFGEVEEVRLVSYHGMKYSHFAPASH